MKNLKAKTPALPRPGRTGLLLTASLVGALSASQARAINYVWSTPPADTNWFNPLNWTIPGSPGQHSVPSGGKSNFAAILNGQTALIQTTILDIEGITVGGTESAPSTLEHTGGSTQPAGGYPGFVVIGPSGNYGIYNMSGNAIQGKPTLEIGTASSDTAPGGHGELNMSGNALFNGSQFAIGYRGSPTNRSFGRVTLSDNARFIASNWMRLENGIVSMTDDATGQVGGDLFVGNRAGGEATLELKANSILEVTGDIYLAQLGASGAINLTGNAKLLQLNNKGDAIHVGTLGSNTGIINVTGNARLETTGNMIVGVDRTTSGNIFQTGGFVSLKDNPGGRTGFTDALEIGSNDARSAEYHLAGGTLKVQTIDARFGSFRFTGGRLAIANRFRGDLVQDGGTMAAGNSPGEVTFENDYTLNAGATLEVEIQGTSDADYDRYLVVNDIILNSPTLDVVLLGGFTPLPGQTFDFMDWGNSLSGTFKTMNLPDLDTGVKWLTDDLYAKGELGVGWAADLDGDGDVDDADFGLMFAQFTGPNNGPPANRDADIDGDGDVDDSDYAVAFATFTGPSEAAVVPEPASLAILLAGGLLTLRRRRG